MTAAHDPGWTAVADNGCTGTVAFGLRCGSQQTVALSPAVGRRCSSHLDGIGFMACPSTDRCPERGNCPECSLTGGRL